MKKHIFAATLSTAALLSTLPGRLAFADEILKPGNDINCTNLTSPDETVERLRARYGSQARIGNGIHISGDVGQGLVLWLPKGAIVRNTLEEFIRVELLKRGYQPVYTPHIGRVEMYETSGHFPYYRDAQFSPLFGHPAGAFVDRWITQLQEGTLTFEAERKFLDFAGLLECNPTEYHPAQSKEEKVAALRANSDWPL